MNELIDPVRYPNFAQILDAVVTEWPKHHKYLAKNIADRDEAMLAFSEKLSGMVVALSKGMENGLPGLASDYRFISEKIVLPEELHFRRHDSYRLRTFQEAMDQVYSNKPFMTRYMNGLLVTDVLWINHCRCMRHYSESFLPSLPEDAKVLEIGPGHGLLLCLATNEPKVGELTAWDVSEASLILSEHSLRILNPEAQTRFVRRNLFDDVSADEGRFDAVVFSEVLEHLEDPQGALDVLHRICKPGGRVWVNVPANSPAPDHLYLVRSPEEAAATVQTAGFEIADQASYPMSGTTLETAIKQKLTVSCIVVGQRLT